MSPSAAADGRTIVRAPNHLGDVVAALPALMECGADVMVVDWLAPLLRIAPLAGEVIPLTRNVRGWANAVAELRHRRYTRGYLMTPSFSAAWLFAWGGVKSTRGTDTDGRGVLLGERVPVTALEGIHRISAYRMLLDQSAASEPLPCRLTPPVGPTETWRERLGTGVPVVGLFPGSNAPARRWPAVRFAEVARAASDAGARVVVMGSAAERTITAGVAGAAPGVIDAGGATDLAELLSVISLCDVLVTNDTGPMHLAGTVGTPTVTVWGPSDPAEVGPVGGSDIRIRGPELPCKPCFKNECPRRGPGTILDDAHEECMRLIEVTEVTAALSDVLQRRARP